MCRVFSEVSFLRLGISGDPQGCTWDCVTKRECQQQGKSITIGFVFFQRKSTIVSSCDFLVSRSLMQSPLGQRPKRALMRSSHTELNVSTYLSVTSRKEHFLQQKEDYSTVFKSQYCFCFFIV